MLQQFIHAPKPSSQHKEKLREALSQLTSGERLGAMPWAQLPKCEDDLAQIETLAKHYRENCDHVVVCGTGGSSLGARALLDLVRHPLGLPADNSPQLHLLESTDPEMLAAATALPAKRTGWIFISKSGSTIETISQFFASGVAANAKAHGPACAITSPGARPLRHLAEQAGIPVYDHNPDLGGRFSVMSIVGLLPAAIAGVDIRAIRRGAASMLEPKQRELAAEAACWQAACVESGQTQQVMMPYVQRLLNWAFWYRQLWAESLGKEGKGSTPFAAIGPMDQHSVLQLILDGPSDKSVTTVQVRESYGERLPVPPSVVDYDYLAKVNGSDVIRAQAYGTSQSMLKRGLPLRELSVERADAESLGALMMLGMLETALTAVLIGIDAFDQPAVEEGKILSIAYLQKP